MIPKLQANPFSAVKIDSPDRKMCKRKKGLVLAVLHQFARLTKNLLVDTRRINNNVPCVPIAPNELLQIKCDQEMD